MKAWEEVALADLGRFSSGKPIVPGQEGQFKAYGSNGVIGGSPEARHDRGIIVGRVGAYCGSVAVSHDPFWASDNTIVIEPTVEDDLDYLYYLLRSANLNRHAGGSAQPLVTQGTLKTLRFPVPEPSLRVRIGQLMADFDELIENNRRRVEVLEEMARAIYREWFVKFRYPGHQDVPFIDSTLGPIPEGWLVSTLSAIAEFTMGQSPRSEFYNDGGIGKPFHQGVADFGRHFPTTRKWCSVEGRSASAGDILISVRAPVGRINVADTDITIGRGLAAVRAKDGRQGLLLGHLREAFAVEDSMGNDGAIFKSIGKAEFASIPVVVPPEAVADSANASFTENFDMIRALSHSTQRLASIRDLLLPKLVTGHIDLASIELDAFGEGQVA